MKTLLLILLVLPAPGCQCLQNRSVPLVFAGGDGSSREQAVIIVNARFRETGHLAERLWLDRKYPGRHETRQSDLNAAGKHFDLVELTASDGHPATVYFDTSECFDR